eukprot:CCRYP_020963-RF/>CCRYP_020963-RF protein AED:0.44 eAED:0.44 QI:0/0/0/1/1/1/2/0/189
MPTRRQTGNQDQRYSRGNTNNGNNYGSNNEKWHGAADRKRPPEVNAVTRGSSNDSPHPPTKTKTHQSEDCNELTPEQKQYRSKLESQLQDGECIELIPRKAFILHNAWDEKKKRAAQVAMEHVLKALKKESEAKMKCWSNDNDDSYSSDVSYVGNKQQPGNLTAQEKKCVQALPDCLRMMIGFVVDGKG